MLDRFLGEQPGGEQYARIRRVGARRDRSDQHVAIADRHVLAARFFRSGRVWAGC
jgi:hypothetical protein